MTNNSKLDTTNNFTLLNQFSEESNSDNEEDNQNQSMSIGKTFMNKHSYIENMLENCGLNIKADDVQRFNLISESAKKSLSNKSFNFNFEPVGSKLLSKKMPMNYPGNPLNKHIPPMSGKRLDRMGNYPIKIINSKKGREISNKFHNDSTILHSFYGDVCETETISSRAAKLKNALSGKNRAQLHVDDNIPIQENIDINSGYSSNNNLLPNGTNTSII